MTSTSDEDHSYIDSAQESEAASDTSRALTLLREAQVALRASKFDEAIERCDEAQPLLITLNEVKYTAFLQLIYAYALLSMQDIDKAQPRAAQARELFQSLGAEAETTSAEGLLAAILAKQGARELSASNYSTAIRILISAEKIHGENSESAPAQACKLLLGSAFLSEGERQLKAGDLKGAGQNLISAQNLFSHIGKIERAAFAASRLGAVHLREGTPTSAVTAFETAREFYSQAESQELNVAICDENIARAHVFSGRVDVSLQLFDKARATFAQLAQPRRAALTDTIFGESLYGSGYKQLANQHFDRAIAQLKSAKAEFDRLGDSRNAERCGVDMGGIWLLRAERFNVDEEVDVIIERLESAASVFAESKAHRAAAQCLSFMGDRYLKSENYHEAVRAYQTAQIAFNQASAPIDVNDCHNNIGVAQALLGNADDAIANLQTAYSKYDGIKAHYATSIVDKNLAACRRRESERRSYSIIHHNLPHIEQFSDIHELPDGSAPSVFSQGKQLYFAANRDNDIEALNRSIEIFGKCAKSPGSVEISIMLAGATYQRFKESGSLDDITVAIAELRRILAQTSRVDPAYTQWSYGLSVALRCRFQQANDAVDIHDALDIITPVIDSIEVDNLTDASTGADVLREYGTILCEIYDFEGGLGNIDAAVDALRASLEMLPAGERSKERTITINNIAAALRKRHEATLNPEDIREATTLSRQAIDEMPHDLINKALLFDNLATALRRSYDFSRNIRDLDDSIESYKLALAEPSTENSSRASSLAGLGLALRWRFDHLGILKDLDESISRGEEAVQIIEGATTGRHTAFAFSTLASSLRARYSHTDEVDDIRAASAWANKAVNAIGNHDPDRASYTYILGSILIEYYQRAGKIELLDEAITQLRATVAKPHGQTFLHLINLAGALRLRFNQSDDNDDLNAAIDALRRAFEISDIEHPIRSKILHDLAQALRRRFDKMKVRSDLDTVVGLARDAIRLVPIDHTIRPGLLTSLGLALKFRYFALSKVSGTSDLNEAIDRFHEAVETAAAEDKDLGTYLHEYGTALLVRFRLSRQGLDVIESVAALRRCISVLPEDDVDRPTILNALSDSLEELSTLPGDRDELEDLVETALLAATQERRSRNREERDYSLARAMRHRFEYRGPISDLDNSIEIFRRISAADCDAETHAKYLGALASSLSLRFTATGNLSDIDEAVAVARTAARAGANGPLAFAYASDLGDALRVRYETSGRAADLDQAVDALRNALGLVDPSGHLVSTCHNNLGIAIRIRYERFGRTDDLQEAVENNWLATVTASINDPHYYRYLSNYSLSLFCLYRRYGNAQHLDIAIEKARRAVDALPVGHPSRSRILANRGMTLMERARLIGDEIDLDDAIQAFTEAVDASEPTSAGYAPSCSNLGAAYHRRYAKTKDPSDLTAAINMLTKSIQHTPPHDSRYCAHQMNLARVLNAKFLDFGSESAGRLALTHAQDSAGHPGGDIDERIEAARLWGRIAHAFGDSVAALQGYRSAVGLLPQRALRGMDRADGERLLERWTGLASEAAAVAIDVGQGSVALELLEEGRAVLWSKMVESRTDIDRLRAADQGLADELADQIRVLEAGSNGRSRQFESSHPDPRMGDRVFTASMTFDDIVNRVRRIDGLDDFLRPVPAMAMHSAASAGPVIVLNVAERRCDALVVLSDRIDVIPLLDLESKDVVAWSKRYVAAQEILADPNCRPLAMAAAEHEVRQALQWLWTSVAKPVLDGVGFLVTEPPKIDVLPRLWWCPTGALSLLPIHAAGEDSGNSVLDYVVSSYTPTVRGLIAARTAQGEPSGRGSDFLIVGMPKTPDHADLPAVEHELRIVKEIFRRPAELIESTATRSNVLEALRLHSTAHLACHGVQRFDQPSESGIVLHDGVLTITNIVDGEQSGGDFVFLSACHGYTGSSRSADESVTLGAALHFVGWIHVVATMWSVNDETAAFIAFHLYSTIVDQNGNIDPRSSAVALHNATHIARDEKASELSWVPFIHIGP
ncbi:CHAT domain-containing protein [Nocardia sp. XZ_19_385]|uniref:CHAT domain-containing tetratricopeptide repeat protein n=1 Tax=Nocardia sp. XZ_19_385 TaxID=2769488 RepID=UPI00188E32CF|nr:CHAT domain-containing protein [Nocardia sp. XZ_19_385]